MKKIAIAAIVLGLAACSSPSSPEASAHNDGMATGVMPTYVATATSDFPTGARVEVTELHQGAHALHKQKSLCDILPKFAEGGGVYRVGRIYTYQEESQPAGETLPVSYVELSLIEAWTPKAPAKAVVRMRGGATAKGIYVGPRVGLKTGEEFAALLPRPTAANKGYYYLDARAVFRPDAESRFSNGMHVLGSNRREAATAILKTFGKARADCAASDVGAMARESAAPEPLRDRVIIEGEVVTQAD